MQAFLEGLDIPHSHSAGAQKFWRFSLDVYRRSGIEQALLALQDEASLDVNCVLFCCWTGMAGYGCLTPAEINAVLEISRGWNVRIVTRLREVRRALKDEGAELDGVSDLRQSVKTQEMAAERIQQTLLVQILVRPPHAAPSDTASRTNLNAYLEARACRLSPHLLAALEHVVACLRSAEIF